VATDAPGPIDPDTILQRSFTNVRRGFDPLEVQKFLMALAGELRSSRERERDQRRRLEEAERNVAELSEMAPGRLASLLGEETTRVLEAANAAASDIRAKAEESVAKLLRDAQDEAARLRREAESVLDRKTKEAEEAADAVRRKGDEELQRARVEAGEHIEAGRRRGREMLTETQRVRERMLRDLARRRKLLRQQIEQLQAGRDRLVEAFDVVRGRVDDATGELEVALPEAKAAAEAAGERLDDEAVQETLEQDLAELTAEVEAGLALREAATVDGEAGAHLDEEPPPDEVSAPGEPGSTTTTEASEDEDASGETGQSLAGRQSSTVRVIRQGRAGAAEEELSEPAEAEPAEATVDEVVPGREGGVAPPPEDAARPPESDPEDVAPTARGSSAKVAGLFARIREEADQGDEGGGAGAPPEESADSLPGQDAPEAPVATLVERRDRAVADFERTVARRLKRELSDEQNELLDAIRREKAVPSFGEAIPAPEDHLERYASAARSTLTSAAGAGAAFGGEAQVSEAPVTPVDDLAAELAAEVVAPLRERLDRCFDEASGDADELAERLRAHYREWKLQRVDAVASHAVLAAFNRGLLDACGPATKVHWVLDDPDAPSPDCEDNALAGNIACGEAFPTGHVAPPAHPSCRCLVVPAGLES
jgi:cell division septum initiation protein DivIVA